LKSFLQINYSRRL